ncbi:MAG: substrate-binding periplasmic protein [Terasakiella sp.]|uniref:substrate-binding periplasmic protein n=1 Tax=unclassified Terasakiella TaxID=2614952 RepID=UPI003B005F4D
MKRVLIILVLLLAWHTPAQSKQVLSVGIYSFEPYFTIAKDGTLGGIWKDLLDQRFKELGLTPVYKALPPLRLAQNIILGRTDMTISAHHININDHVFYSNHPVGHITLNAYHKKDRPHISDLSDLRGKSVLIIRGYAYDGRIRFLKDPANKITVLETAKHQDAIRQLQNGNVDYLLDYERPTKNAIEKNQMSPDDFHIDLISQYSAYFVISKRSKNARAIMDSLDQNITGTRQAK